VIDSTEHRRINLIRRSFAANEGRPLREVNHVVGDGEIGIAFTVRELQVQVVEPFGRTGAGDIDVKNPASTCPWYPAANTLSARQFQ
jgi:hypothetical protein